MGARPTTTGSGGGFTLVELMVVLVIIGILVVVLVPVVKGVRERSKEQAVSTNTAAISQALNNFASQHDGFYPGVMLDITVPFKPHALGDIISGGGVLWPAGNPINPYNAATPLPGNAAVWNGVVGDGFDSNALAAAKQAGSFNVPKFFDVLAAEEALTEYPVNLFAAGAGGAQRMVNIFQFLFDPTRAIGVNNPIPILLVPDNGEGIYPVTTGFNLGPIAARVEFNPITNGGVPFPTLPITYANRAQNPFEPSPADGRPGFAPGETAGPNGRVRNFFAPGDFAYVPVLSAGPYASYIGSPIDPDSSNFEDDRFKAGTLVSGYYLFGFGRGDADPKELRFEQEKQDFYARGIPGFGGPGVDTQYEMAVAALFNGAVYFEKVGVR